ncbi:MAG: 50S ribosomal protein L25 [Patescibacteria group bacterium]
MKLEVAKRNTEEGLESLRSKKLVPAICYGPDIDPISIQIPYGEVVSLLHKAGSSTIIDLEVAGEGAHEVLIKDIQRHPVTEDILHIDFYAIKRGEEIEIDVPLEFVGQSKAAQAGGVLTYVMYELPVRCRPRNLPEKIEIDLSLLAELGQAITVADIHPGEGVTILSEPEEAIAIVSEAKEEVEEEDTSAEDIAEVLAGDEGEESEESAKGE